MSKRKSETNSREDNSTTVASVAELPDLDSRERIAAFIDAFYARVLADEQLAPIFLEVAGIDLDVHLPHIRSYWCKLLLGDDSYRRHTMNIHRQLHVKQSLRQEDFERWLELFTETLDAHYRGEKADRARRVAQSIAGNMQTALL